MMTKGPILRRMLFLHGQFLPPECYETTLASDFLATIRDKGWECVFLKSPRVTPDKAPDLVFQLFPHLESKDLPEWINSESHEDEDGSKTYHGLEDSVAFVQKYLQEQPRFDVIAGHSNGALLASILALKMESDPDFLVTDKHPSGVLLFNAPASYENERHLGDIVKAHGTVAMPSIHVWGGPTDMTWEGQQKLKAVHHPTGKVVQHESGHFFPKEQSYYTQIADLLNEILPPKN